MMPVATAEVTPLVGFMLPGTPSSVPMARFYIRAALAYHGLAGLAGDAEAVATELAANAIEHAGAEIFGLDLMSLGGSGAVAVIVTDPSPSPPVQRHPAGDTERGRGLNIVAALSVSWGWRPQARGKAVYAILGGQVRDAGRPRGGARG
jgi:anti-sigma regulatory factor (Ser/Thr protein kinase)